MDSARVEILSIAGCPNAIITRTRVREALALEACRAEILDVVVDTPEAAHEQRFLGSPSVRVNGQDV